MQVKTINKTIKNKINDWLESINDETLVKHLKKDIIVTGGCITSLFLQEKVNDYDIYIRTKNTLRLLVNYYTKDLQDIRILDGINKEKYITELEKLYTKCNIDKTIEKIDNIYAITLRNLKENQIKLFFDGKPGLRFDNKDETKKYQLAYLSPNAISLTDDIQIVIRFYGEPEDIHKNYDFVHATNWFTLDEGLVTNLKALESILSKQLYYQGSLYPVTSIIRLKKFINRKWNITAGEILKILFQVSQLDLSNPDVLEEQLIGVDIAYFSTLIEMLRNTKNEQLDEEYLFSLINKVFDEDETENSNL